MLKILMHGACGRMGRMIARQAEEMDSVTVTCGVDMRTADDLGFPVFSSLSDVDEAFDVIIDFTNASTLSGLLEYAVEKRVPCVIASTGHTAEQKQQIRDAAKVTPVFYSANFSLGVNVLLALCRRAASALSENFDIEIVEKHHNQKLDAPSGTALMLADGIASVLEYEPEYVYTRHNRHETREKKEIGISAVRGGTIVGEHDVIFAGNQEVVSLSHTAYSREIFAVGALKAAQYLADLAPGLYDMESMIEDRLK
ncbi:MAG: 4-hydroxy-tetrahydrodipicolinate reductase [Clostridia bacterium]|nr:4-hydroxy-tetrahydrodipicolinate reductase [Clostridia bacterium]